MKIVVVLLAALLSPVAWSQSLNPAVTQDNIKDTICVPGWSASIRPSRSYTGTVKRRLLRRAGIPLSHSSQYELDHIVPLSTGGAPLDPKNLRLQAWDGVNGARAKDAIEVKMLRAVCAGRVPLTNAQSCMASDFRQCKVR